MPHENKRRVLLIIPESVLKKAGEAAEKLQISRLAFIRQAICQRLEFFEEKAANTR